MLQAECFRLRQLLEQTLEQAQSNTAATDTTQLEQKFTEQLAARDKQTESLSEQLQQALASETEHKA